jgi:hypothetical protein
MRSFIIFATLIVSFSLQASVETGKPAPHYQIKSNASHKDPDQFLLKNLKGKVVVLEWLNHGCPFVRKHYDSGNMQALQQRYTSQGVIWLSVISSAPGKQGHVSKEEALEEMVKNKSLATDVILDPEGAMGKLYGAKTTPHMFVINQKGLVVYQGAIDDKPDTEKSSIDGAKNYVAEALDLTLKNKPVTLGSTKAYGCSVKYK